MVTITKVPKEENAKLGWYGPQIEIVKKTKGKKKIHKSNGHKSKGVKIKKVKKVAVAPVMTMTMSKSHASEFGETLVKELKKQLPIEMVSDNMSTVGASIGFTKNLGNYESIKIQVSLFRKAEPKDEEKQFKDSYKRVEEWIDEITAEINEDISG